MPLFCYFKYIFSLVCWLPLFLLRSWLIIVLGFPYNDSCFFFLLSRFLLFFGFQYFYYDVFFVYLFVFILLEVPQTSWKYRWVFFIKYGHFLWILFLLSFSSSFCTLMYMLVCLMLSFVSLKLCTFFFVSLFFRFYSLVLFCFQVF